MSLRTLYKSHCHSRLIKPLAQFGRALNRFYENSNYDASSNGERRVLSMLKGFDIHTVLDVGANVGDWVTIAHGELPEAEFHCFEPVPEVYSQLSRRCDPLGAKAYAQGLGATAGELSFFYYADGHALSSHYSFSLHAETPKKINVAITTGDEFLLSRSIPKVDFLKVDTEGHDLSVLKGFEKHLATRKIRVIQFEYGRINIVSKALLKDFYELLTAYGYRVGKIYPKSVDFGDYHFGMEDFVGPNYLAVLSEEADMVRALK